MMRRKPSGFDRIARVYDGLAFLVFGNRIVHAQTFFLDKLADRATVLVLGGGTGKFLPLLLKINRGCQVWYIDSSAQMIDLARQRIAPADRVHFIRGTEEDIPSGVKYDAVITHFYLDLFNKEKLAIVIEKIKMSLAPDVRWLVSDFVNKDAWWSRSLLRLMYFFFNTTTEIEAKKLPDWRTQLSLSGFGAVQQNSFYSGFIETCVYHPM